jgi:hypothetical protein
VADLELGPLPNQKTTRVTVMLPGPLKEELDAYAVEHSMLYGAVETAALIPHMLQALFRTDRSWCSRRKRRGKHIGHSPFPDTFSMIPSAPIGEHKPISRA